MPPSRDPPSLFEFLIPLGLVLVTLAVFWPMPDVQFTNYDDPCYAKSSQPAGRNDPFYVPGNAQVLGGVSWVNARWALTAFACANWHPLTWLSLQLDAQLHGGTAYGFRVTNVLLHAANALFVFWVWRRLTNRPGPSALMAALFALHPLHVESVAWISERKDVLSTLFGLLALLAYAGYVRRPGWVRYLGVLVLFALGLAAKPMMVTLPCVLLLLDFWPLGRFRGPGRRPLGIWLEKLPLFVLSAASCAVTLLAQERGHAVQSLDEHTLSDRLANAVVSYAAYLVQTVWPGNLAAYYPYEHLAWSDWRVVAALPLLAGITAVAVWQAVRRPYLLVGWLWYLGTLVPVIGLVQVGGQARADRYTYFPLIGVFVMIAWSLAELARRGAAVRRLVAGGSTAALLTCAALSWLQVTYWQSSFALWAHTLAATGPNPVAYNGLGAAFREVGNYPRAVEEYRRALTLVPGDTHARMNLGWCLFVSRRFREAAAEFADVLRAEPDNANAHFQLGVIAGLRGKTAEAVGRYEKVLRLRPGDATAHVNLAIELIKQGRGEAASWHLDQAASYRPEVRDLPAFRAALEAAKEKRARP
jgi:tetratricopeptide (TPR) repeat protein